ncbi:hypothetical protein M422DRAFT_248537 [Sphaerobolus stellatus SS14]|uniref:Uncharacterized protein n=1 Tax=Sphaerobolus stellatus (strain SS14) TaxID=990650 RepID=A0A0C9VW19_SPHS4|nr:hypothetical protein M422DRAFT_248537 [Sphaerobolus stellatus SS14]
MIYETLHICKGLLACIPFAHEASPVLRSDLRRSFGGDASLFPATAVGVAPTVSCAVVSSSLPAAEPPADDMPAERCCTRSRRVRAQRDLPPTLGASSSKRDTFQEYGVAGGLGIPATFLSFTWGNRIEIRSQSTAGICDDPSSCFPLSISSDAESSHFMISMKLRSRQQNLGS